MLIILLIAAFSTAAFFGFLWFKQCRAIKKTAASLNAIRTDNDSENRRLTLPTPDASLELLIREINFLLSDRQNAAADYRGKEADIRRQIANISHDLRTPLTSILGYTQLMSTPDISESDRSDFCQIVEKRARTLQTLLTGFYDLSRIESGEYPLEITPIALEPPLTRTLAAFYEDFTTQGIEPDVSISPNLPLINADETAVTRIFTNIIQNIIKHGTGPVQITLAQEAYGVTAQFKNPAGNLSPEDAASVFDRFFTADRMRTGQNTGLGLAIVKQLAEAMGHQVEATLEGEQFVLTLHFYQN